MKAWKGIFRGVVFIVLACFLAACGSLAEDLDLSGYTLEDLKMLRDRIEQTIQELEVQDALENGDRLIQFEEGELLLYVGQKRKISPVVVRRAETAPAATTLLWETEDPDVLTVSNGWITPLSPGETVITAKARDDERIQAGIPARVANSVSTVALDQSSLELVLTSQENPPSARLQARISPEDALHQELIWTSSNEEIVTVDQDGNLTAVQPGRATVMVQTNDPSLKQQKKSSCSVTVLQAVTALRLTESSTRLEPGKTLRLSASVLPENATGKTVEWESSDPGVASVNPYGTVTGNQPGECIITCSAADGYGASASCRITVTRLVTKITDVDHRQSLGLRIGGEASVTVQIEPEDAAWKQLQWTLSDHSVADIIKAEGETVTLLGRAPGSAVLTGTSTDGSGISIQYKITVEDECSVKCTGKVETGVSYGYKWFTLEFENASVSRTVDGLTIRYYAEDVYGEKMKSYGIGDEEVETTFNLTIEPGKTKSSPQEIIYGFNQAKTIHAAIVKLHYTNGDIVECPEPEYLGFELSE